MDMVIGAFHRDGKHVLILFQDKMRERRYDMEFPVDFRWISGGWVDFDGGNPGNFGAASLTSKSSVVGGGRRGGQNNASEWYIFHFKIHETMLIIPVNPIISHKKRINGDFRAYMFVCCLL